MKLYTLPLILSLFFRLEAERYRIPLPWEHGSSVKIILYPIIQLREDICMDNVLILMLYRLLE